MTVRRGRVWGACAAARLWKWATLRPYQRPTCRRRAIPASASSVNHRMEDRSEEHTSELQSLRHLVCRLLLEKKKQQEKDYIRHVRRYTVTGVLTTMRSD